MRKIIGTAVAAILIGAPATARATAPEVVTIEVERPAEVWSASGAIADAGTFADERIVFTGSFTLHGFRTFIGSDGTFTARADVRIVPTAQPGIFGVTGVWAVVAGTGGYRDLRGRGTIAETFDADAGTVVGVWEGSVHFDGEGS